MDCTQTVMRPKGGKALSGPRAGRPEIGEPLNFSHVVHVAPRPLVNLNDPHIQIFLKQAGVRDDQLSQLEVYETIVNFIQVHGVEQVKSEVKVAPPAAAVAAAADVTDAAVQEEAAVPQQMTTAPKSESSSESDSEDEAQKEPIPPAPAPKEPKEKRPSSPNLLARWFKGKKKPEAAAKEKEPLKEASSHQIEVETVEAVQKVLDEEEKLLESEAKAEEPKRHNKKKFLFRQDKKSNGEDEEPKSPDTKKKKKGRSPSVRSDPKWSGDEEEPETKREVPKVTASFFSRPWGKQREGGDSKRVQKSTPKKPDEEEKPKKTAGIFKRNLKRSSRTHSTSSDDDEESVNLKPEGDADDDIVVEQPPPKSHNVMRLFKGKPKKAASVDALETPNEDDSSSDEEDGKKTQPAKHKREFFKFKGKKTVSADIHPQEKKPTEVDSKVKQESSESYEQLQNDDDDEVFKREAAFASKLDIIPKSTPKGSKPDKAATLDSKSGIGGFLRLSGRRSSRRKKSVSLDDVVVPYGPRNSLPEENKQHVKKYKVRKFPFYSTEATSSDEQPEPPQRKTKASSSSSEDLFKRLRRSLSETKEKRQSKRRSSLDLQQTSVTVETATVTAESEPIYENFPLQLQQQKPDDERSTDEDADEFYAQYHEEKSQLSHARRSWSFVMAELKEKMNSVEEDPEQVLRGALQLQEMRSDPNLAERRSSSSSEEDHLMAIRASIEKLDREFKEAQATREKFMSIYTTSTEQSPTEKKTLAEVLMCSESKESTEIKLSNLTTFQVTTSERKKSADVKKSLTELRRSSEELHSPTIILETIMRQTAEAPKFQFPEPELLVPTRPPPPIPSTSDDHQPKSIIEETIVPIRAPPPRPDVLPLPLQTRMSSGSTTSGDSEPAASPSDSLEPTTHTGTMSPDSLDATPQDTNNNEDADTAKRRTSTESRPLSDCQLHLAGTIDVDAVVVRPPRRLERGSRVSKRPTSSLSSDAGGTSSLPTSPKTLTPPCSSTSSSFAGQSIPSSTEDLNEDKENVQIRRSSYNDDVFITEAVLSSGKRTSVERNASYHRAVEISSSLPLPRKNSQPGRRNSSSSASRIPRPILKKPRRRTVDEVPMAHRVTEL